MYYDPLASDSGMTDADSALPRMQNDEMPPEESNSNQNGGNNNDGTVFPPNAPEGQQPLPNDSIDPNLLSLAMGFVPYQAWETPYANDVAISRGTIFPSLDKPFLGECALSGPTPRQEG